MYADIIVDISVDALDKTYQYRIPEQMEELVRIGTPVQVPFGRGNRILHGFVVNLTEQPAFDVNRIKDILKVEQKQVPVEGQLLALAGFIRDRYGSTMNEALKTVLPVRKKIKSVEEHWLNFAMEERFIMDILHEYERNAGASCRGRHDDKETGRPPVPGEKASDRQSGKGRDSYRDQREEIPESPGICQTATRCLQGAERRAERDRGRFCEGVSRWPAETISSIWDYWKWKNGSVYSFSRDRTGGGKAGNCIDPGDRVDLPDGIPISSGIR